MIKKLNQEEINNIAGGMIVESDGEYRIFYTGNDYPEPTEVNFPGLNFPCIIQNGHIVFGDLNRHCLWTKKLLYAQDLDRMINPKDSRAGQYLQRVLEKDPLTNQPTKVSAPELIAPYCQVHRLNLCWPPRHKD